jgi:transposase
MGFIQGVGRTPGTLFPVTLAELIPEDHVCRVLDAFVGRLDMEELGFVRAEAAETGRPGYDPRDLLKLYLYGYLQQIRSSRRLEAECQRNLELLWLLGRLAPDHKSIAEFRRLHRDAVTQAGAELIRFACSVGLVRGEWVAIDGSKIRAVSSSRSGYEREALKRYLERLEEADAEEELEIDASAVAAALEKRRQHTEPEARFLRTTTGKVPAYNVQTAVDAEHALIVAQQVSDEATDNRSLQPMAEAAQAAVGALGQTLHVVADAGYSNGEQAEACEAQGIVPHVPANRGVNNRGDGTLFDRRQFQYDLATDTFLCPAGQSLQRHQRAPFDRLCRPARSLWSVPVEVSLYGRLPSLAEATPARCRAPAHAATGYTRGDAAAKIHGRTSLCELAVPDFWPSSVSVAWAEGSADGNQFGSHGLQLEADDQRHGRGSAASPVQDGVIRRRIAFRVCGVPEPGCQLTATRSKLFNRDPTKVS